jgi:hypothetical protein
MVGYSLPEKMTIGVSTSTKSKRDNESITFRLDLNVLKALRSEAAQKDISMNTLVNQVIKQHMTWHRNASRAGFIPSRKSFLTKVIDSIPEEKISNISKEIATRETKDFVLLLRNEYSIQSALSVIESWIRNSGFAFKHENTEALHSYVIQHDMGKKMSIYFAEFFRNLFNDFGIENIQFDLTEKSIVFVVDISHAQ